MSALFGMVTVHALKRYARFGALSLDASEHKALWDAGYVSRHGLTPKGKAALVDLDACEERLDASQRLRDWSGGAA